VPYVFPGIFFALFTSFRRDMISFSFETRMSRRLICQRDLFRYVDATNGYKQIQTTQIFREMPFTALPFTNRNRIYTLLNITESQGFIKNLLPE